MEAPSLGERWRALAVGSMTMPDDEVDDLHRDLLHDTAVAALAADSKARSALLEVFRRESDVLVRSWLAEVFVPHVTLALGDPEAFRAHSEVRMTRERLPIRPALGLPVFVGLEEANPEFRSNPLSYTGSWYLGGPAVPAAGADSWVPPRRHDGVELTFLAQVDLAAFSAMAEDFTRLGLPEYGIIQLFHDLETYGWDENHTSGAWRVRWVDTPLPDHLHLDPAHYDALLPMNPLEVPTVPSSLDAPESVDDERYERIRLWLEQAAYELDLANPDSRDLATPWDEPYTPVQPMSRMSGYGSASIGHEELHECLQSRLPLAPRDRHMLLFDLNPATFGHPDWFHGGHHLEVWARASEVAAANFEQTWAVIRTDS